MAADIQDWTTAVNVIGGSVAILGTATVTISGTPAVTISGTPAVSISSGTVAISGTVSVSITGANTVILGTGSNTIGSISAIGSTVTVAGTVNIGNTPAVSISGTPTVNINSGSVSITGTPNINIAGQSVTVGVNLPQQDLGTLNMGIGTTTQQTTVVPSGCHALMFANSDTGGTGLDLTGVTIKGHTTGVQYWPPLATFGFVGGANIWNKRALVVPLPSVTDTSFDVTGTNGGVVPMSIRVTALLDPQAVYVSNTPATPIYVAISTKDLQNALPVDLAGSRYRTYRAAGQFVPPAAATDIIVISASGAGSVVVEVLWIRIRAITTTAVTAAMHLIKRSTLDTLGTFVAATKTPLDSSSSAANAGNVGHYTANPTLGTLVGEIGDAMVFVPLTTALGGEVVWEFGTRGGQPVLLRPTTEQLAVNLNGATIAAPNFTYEIEWRERANV